MIAVGSATLAWRSLHARRSAFLATICSIALATALIGSFATLIETAQANGMSPADRETLMTIGIVVGSWGTIIALFSLTSTIGIAVRQRDTEIGLFRTIGGTPQQARQLIRLETAAVAVVGTVLGAALALAGGAGLLALLRSGDLVASTVDYQGGPASVGATAAALVLVSLLAATLAGRTPTNRPAGMAIAQGQTGSYRTSRWRAALGVALVGYGVAMAVLTITVLKDSDEPYVPAMAAGGACVVAGVGLAALAPVLLRWASKPLGAMLRLGGVPGYLAGFNTARRGHLLAGVLGPVIIFVSTTVGVLMMVGIDGRTLEAVTLDLQEARTITLVNNIVTGMIALFAAIMVVNSLAAVIGQRRTEFARLRLAGATPEQVRGSVLAEAATVAGVGVVLGLAASLATVIPYSIARDEGVLPNGQLWLPAVLAAVAVGITVGGAATATRRALRTGDDAGPLAVVAT